MLWGIHIACDVRGMRIYAMRHHALQIWSAIHHIRLTGLGLQDIRHFRANHQKSCNATENTAKIQHSGKKKNYSYCSISKNYS